MPAIASNNPLFTTPSANLTPEQDALRWRALMERIAALERAAGVAVKYNATAAPGGSEIVSQTIRAGKILGPGSPMTSTVSDDFQNLIRIVYDGNGVQRVQQGNLSPYTDPSGVASPGGFSFRLLDSSGNILLDGTGPSQVMKSLGVTDATNQNFTNTTFFGVSGSAVSFSISRQVNILALFLGTGKVTTNNGNVGFLRARLLSGPGTTSGNLTFGVLANFAQTSSGWLWIPALAAGSYTVQLEAAINATPQTFTMIEGALQVFQTGA